MAILLTATNTPSAGNASEGMPERIEARLSAGHDSNLLDASDAERASFDRKDPGTFFVVNSVRDEFLEGEVRSAWRLPRVLAGRPSVNLSYQRRQYLNNPIKSSDRYGFETVGRVAARTRLDLTAEFQPQIYGRHRRNDQALPGEPEFSPEVQRRTDVSAELAQGVSSSTTLKVGIEGSLRDERAPFDARDRRLFGASAGASRSLAWGWRAGLSGGYRWTRSRNDPMSPTDLSNREWTVSPRLEGRTDRLAAALEISLDLGRRLYTSDDPADATHFGRQDRVVGVETELSRQFGSLASVTRFTWRSRMANITTGAADDETFSDAELQTGIRWSHSIEKDTRP